MVGWTVLGGSGLSIVLWPSVADSYFSALQTADSRGLVATRQEASQVLLGHRGNLKKNLINDQNECRLSVLGQKTDRRIKCVQRDRQCCTYLQSMPRRVPITEERS